MDVVKFLKCFKFSRLMVVFAVVFWEIVKKVLNCLRGRINNLVLLLSHGSAFPILMKEVIESLFTSIRKC